MKGLVFTYLLCYGGAVASIFKPWYGLLVYIIFSILKPDALWHWSVPQGNYSRIVAIALLVGWAFNGFGHWNFGRARLAVFGAVGYLAWSAVSAVQAANQTQAWSGYVEPLAKIILPFVVGVTLIDTPAKVRQMLWAITLSVGYLGIELNQLYLNGYDLQSNGFLNLDNNSICLVLTPGMGLGIFLAQTEKSWFLKGLALLICLAIAHVCMFSFSRGAMLAMVATGCVAFLLTPKTPKHYLMLFLAGLICFRLMGKEVTEEFTSSFAEQNERDDSAQGRLDLWRDCTDVMMKNPVLGIGPNHWPLVAPSYGWPPGKEAHSTWFQVAAELGFPGIVFLLIMYGTVIWHSWLIYLRRRSTSDPAAVATASAVIAGLIGVMVSISFVTAETVEVPYYVAMTGVAALALPTTMPSIAVDPADQGWLAGRQATGG